jgi:hypothetical protein
MTVNTATPDYIVDGVLTDGEAWVPLGTTILSSGAVNIGFTSTTGANDWSQYMNLVLISYLRSDESATSSYLRLMVNSASVVTGGYDDQGQWTVSTTNTGSKNTSTTQGMAGYIAGSSAGANIFSAHVTTIFDINSGKYTNMQTKSAQDLTTVSGHVANWNTTRKSQAPVTSVYVSLYPTGSDDLVSGSRVDLFGVLPRMVTA